MYNRTENYLIKIYALAKPHLLPPINMTDIFSLCERDKPEEVAAILQADPDLVDDTDSVSILLNSYAANY